MQPAKKSKRSPANWSRPIKPTPRPVRTDRVVREVLTDEAISRAVQRTLKDPIWFANNILRVSLDPWQAELLNAVWDVYRKKIGLPTKVNHEGLNKITVRAMHGPGKTFGLAVLVLAWFFCHKTDRPSFATAPKEKQLLDRLWPAISQVYGGAIAEFKALVKIDSTRVTFAGDRNWGITAETASHPDNLAGFHDDWLLALCEEANGIEEKFYPVIEGALSTGFCPVMVLIGNPTSVEGTFADSHLKPEVAKNYYRLHVSLEKTKRVPADHVRQMIEKYGEDSDIVRVRCFGEFPKNNPDQLIFLHWVQQAFGREVPKEFKGVHPRKFISVDVADGGENATVLTVIYDYGDFDLWTKQVEKRFPPHESIPLTSELAKNFWEDEHCSAANGDRVIVDSVGVGTGVAGMLMRDYEIPVVAFRGGEGSDDPDKWRNLRTQSYVTMADRFRKGTIGIADDFATTEKDRLELVAQLTCVRRKPHQARVDEIETKKDMAQRGIVSPDRADSCSMRYARSSLKASLSNMTFGESGGEEMPSVGSPFLSNVGGSPWD